jgi:hypothetical protein
MVLHILFLFFVFLFCFCSIFGLFALQRLRCAPCLQMEDPPQSLLFFFWFICLAAVALCAVLADGGSSTVFTVAFLPLMFADARPGFCFVSE